jgi:hypothetical protein
VVRAGYAGNTTAAAVNAAGPGTGTASSVPAQQLQFVASSVGSTLLPPPPIPPSIPRPIATTITNTAAPALSSTTSSSSPSAPLSVELFTINAHLKKIYSLLPPVTEAGKFPVLLILNAFDYSAINDENFLDELEVGCYCCLS